MNINRKKPSILWLITGIVAIILLAISSVLVVKARNLSNAGFMAFITGEGQTVYVRNQPSENSQIATILEHGSSIFVTDQTTRNGLQWYRVQWQEVTGWVLAENISLSSP